MNFAYLKKGNILVIISKTGVMSRLKREKSAPWDRDSVVGPDRFN